MQSFAKLHDFILILKINIYIFNIISVTLFQLLFNTVYLFFTIFLHPFDYTVFVSNLCHSLVVELNNIFVTLNNIYNLLSNVQILKRVSKLIFAMNVINNSKPLLV
jgi:hypothetical protein